jgi:hypothetical protein
VLLGVLYLQIVMQQAFFTFESTCSTCGGSGQTVKVLFIIENILMDSYFYSFIEALEC